MTEKLGGINEEHESNKLPARKEMSRRTFLNYTLGGTGAFMLGLPIIQNIRFAVDPLLQKGTASEFVKVVEEAKITADPQSFRFKIPVVDGWYEHEPEVEAWVARNPETDQVYALSPVCKHLGCTVGWNNNDQYPDQFFCPCHGAHYTPVGESLAVSPQPLDEYEVQISEDGWVLLGGIKANTIV